MIQSGIFDSSIMNIKKLANSVLIFTINRLIEIIGIFILPPDYITLEERLINRKKDSSTTIKQRMNAALDEISHYKEFDFIVVNDKFDETLAKLNEIISDPKTDHNRRNRSHDNFISKIMAQRD